MALAENTVVSIEYELREQGGSEILDTNVGGAPLEFMIGRSHIIPGLEKELLDVKKGDAKTVTVLPAKAYGEYSKKALMDYPRDEFAGIELQEGMTLYGQGEDGQTVQVRVASFDDKSVTVDYNHPLAGKTLVFNITVADVREPTQGEIDTGLPESMQHSCSCGCGTHSHEEEHGHSCGCGDHSCGCH